MILSELLCVLLLLSGRMGSSTALRGLFEDIDGTSPASQGYDIPSQGCLVNKQLLGAWPCVWDPIPHAACWCI
jgi:hypothetical protein